MKKNKIIEDLKNDDKNNFINIDINIFSDLRKIQEQGKFKTYKHKTYTFVYLWLCSYLWRYSKYGNIKILPEDIKEALGYARTNKTVDYIVKSGGLLDQEGFTETSRDFPIHTEVTEKGVEVFHLSDELPETKRNFFLFNGNRYCYKKPLQQIQRIEDGQIKAGLSYSRDDVVKITIEEYNMIMNDEESGILEFYLYCYIKRRCKQRGFDKVKIFSKEFSNDIGCNVKTIYIAANNLKRIGIIECKTRVFSDGQGITKENIYSIPNRFGKLTKLKYASVSSQEVL